MRSAPYSPTPVDHLIDELLYLQTRYAALIWRLNEREGIEIEFFLEEMAIEFAATLNRKEIPARHLPRRPRRVWLPQAWLAQGSHADLRNEIENFLEKQTHLTHLYQQE